jgi:hypothetical protein
LKELHLRYGRDDSFGSCVDALKKWARETRPRLRIDAFASW